jgi:hypothetical protein
LTARGGKGSGGASPPLPAVRSSNGGRTRWHHPRPEARRRQWLRLTRENRGGRGCLGGCWGWCGFDGVLGGGFYRPERAGVGVSRRWGSDGWQRQRRARRPWERAGEVRSRRWGTVGVLWRAHAGRKGAERQRGKERGPGLFPPFLPGLSDGVRAGEVWSRQRGTLRVRRRARAYEIGVINSGFDFTEICPPSVRSNAHMNLNFENLKSATVGCQDNS